MEQAAKGQGHYNEGILHPQGQYGFVLGEEPQEGLREEQPHQHKQNRMYPRTQQPVDSGAAGFLWAAGAQAPGDAGVETHAQAHCHRQGQVLQGVHQRHRCQGFLAQMGYKNTVHNIVQSLNHHRDHGRHGHG